LCRARASGHHPAYSGDHCGAFWPEDERTPVQAAAASPRVSQTGGDVSLPRTNRCLTAGNWSALWRPGSYDSPPCVRQDCPPGGDGRECRTSALAAQAHARTLGVEKWNKVIHRGWETENC